MRHTIMAAAALIFALCPLTASAEPKSERLVTNARSYDVYVLGDGTEKSAIWLVTAESPLQALKKAMTMVAPRPQKPRSTLRTI